MADAFPLQWPIGRPRWQSGRTYSQFKMTPGAMSGHLFDELDRLGAEEVVVSSNKKPYSRSEKELYDDPGVAVYFKRKGREIAIACDRYIKQSDNLHAIGLAVEAFRSLERHGTGEMVDAAFSGFAALPESIIMGPGQSRTWYEVLQVSQDADPSIVRSAWRSLVGRYHPDGSDPDPVKYEEVQRAYDESGKR